MMQSIRKHRPSPTHGIETFNFVEPSKMLTRQGRKSDDMDDKITAALKDAGIDNVENMGEEEKRDLFNAIMMSSRVSSQGNEHFQQDSPGSPERSPNSEAQNSNNDVVMEENVVQPIRQVALGQPGSSQPPKTAGRGRGKPVKTKYPSLSLNSPGQKPDLVSSSIGSKAVPSNQRASPMGAQSPPNVPRSQSPSQSFDGNSSRSPDDIDAFADPSSPASPPSHSTTLHQSPDMFTHMDHDMGAAAASEEFGGAEKEASQSDNDILVDVEQSGPEEGAICDIEPDSPASIQDVGDDEKEPLRTVLIGKIAAEVSPLETMNRDCPRSGYPSFFQELEKYRGNKAEWMAKANEIVKEQRIALWKKLKEDNPIWGPPIPDGGSLYKRSLFKETSQATPKYSQLFSNSAEKQAGPSTSSGRMERQSKTKAAAKIQEAIHSPDWVDEHLNFHNMRQSKQKNQGNRSANNPWQSRMQQDAGSNDDGCREITPSNSEKWPSNRVEQRGSDYEVPPESPKASADVYAYEDEDNNDSTEEIWEPVANKGRKNVNKKGGRSIQGNAELDARGAQRGRGAGPRNTKLRLQKGAISHPSQHGQNSRHNKGGSSDATEGETNARNNANIEGQWLRTDRTDNEATEIPSKSFYSPKVVPPRNSTVRRSGDNLRAAEFSPAPSTSGDSPGQQCPICEKMFPADKIEAHASDCNRFLDAPAEGEKSESEDQDSEEPDKAVNELKSIESVKSIEETKEATTIYFCENCKQRYSKSTISDHLKKCYNLSKKRANSIDDDGPVKKSRCMD